MESPHFPDIKGYTPIVLCGQGAYGQVWLVKDFSNRQLALKVVSKRALGGDWKREYNGLVTYRQKVKNHPNLIEIYHIEDTDSFFYYTMECADNLGNDNEYIPSTLEHLIERFGKVGPETIVNVFDQLLDGVEALHEAGVIHRDIKPDNIIFVNTVPKLSDIGLITSMSKSISLVGTQPYLPPEVIMGNAESKESSSIDLYAIGKSIYRAFSGNTPDNFPKVDAAILADKQCKKINKLVKIACHTIPFVRFKDIDSFRNALDGNIGVKYEFKIVVKQLLSIILFPLYFAITICKLIWHTPWLRFSIIAFLLIWVLRCGYTFCSTTNNWSKPTWLNLSRFWFIAKSQTIGVPQYDAVDFMSPRERKYYKDSGKKRLVSKKKYMEMKLTGTVNQRTPMALSVGGETDNHFTFSTLQEKPLVLEDIPRHNKLIYNASLNSFKGWTFGGNGIVVTGDTINLPPQVNGKLSLDGISLPNEYEISFKINLSDLDGYIQLGAIAEEYIPNWQKMKYPSKLHSKYFFTIKGDGKLAQCAPVLYRKQDKTDDDLITVCKSSGKLKANNKFREIKIIMTRRCLRIFINGYIYYFGESTFSGGIFNIKYSNKSKSNILIKDFEIRAIKSINKKELGENLEYKLPQPIKRGKSTLNKSAEKYKTSSKPKEPSVKTLPKKEAKKTSINILPKQIVSEKSLPVKQKQEHKTLVKKSKPLIKQKIETLPIKPSKKPTKTMPEKSLQKITKQLPKGKQKKSTVKKKNKKYTPEQVKYIKDVLSDLIDDKRPSKCIPFGAAHPHDGKLQGTPRISKIIYNSSNSVLSKSFVGDVQNVSFEKHQIKFYKKNSMITLNTNLPHEYDIALNIKYNKFIGMLKFLISASYYPPDLDISKQKKMLPGTYSFDFTRSSLLSFNQIKYQRGGSTREMKIGCYSQIFRGNKDSQILRIIMTRNKLRIFCNNELISSSPALFKGGTLHIMCLAKDGSVVIKDIVIRDIRSFSKEDVKKYPRYKLPPRRSGRSNTIFAPQTGR